MIIPTSNCVRVPVTVFVRNVCVCVRISLSPSLSLSLSFYPSLYLSLSYLFIFSCLFLFLCVSFSFFLFLFLSESGFFVGPKDLQWFIRHFSSVDKSTAPNINIDYPQVPGSIPAETPRSQIHMDLSW